MKRVLIKDLKGRLTHSAEMEDPTSWVADGIANGWWGLAERWVDISEPHDQADVLDESEELDPVTSDIIHKVKLRATYTVEMVDVTDEFELEECLRKRRRAYPTPEEFLNAYFDGGDAALEELKQKRLAIKVQFPKP